jgi:hypothetical protein
MRITSSLIAFIFLGVAAGGVVPDIARRDSSGGKGGHSASMSGVHPSGSPTGASVDSIPSGIHSHSAAHRREANPTYVHSVHPLTRRADPTGSHSLPSGSPAGASDHPAPSAGNPSHSAASRRGQPTDGQSHSPASQSPSASDGHSMQPSQPSGASQPEHSGSASGASGHPNKSGSPSDASVQPKPTASHA